MNPEEIKVISWIYVLKKVLVPHGVKKCPTCVPCMNMPYNARESCYVDSDMFVVAPGHCPFEQHSGEWLRQFSW